MIKTIYNTIKNKKLRPYRYRTLKGLIGAIEGIYDYYRNDRQSLNQRAYVNYYMVRKITGKDPLKNV